MTTTLTTLPGRFFGWIAASVLRLVPGLQIPRPNSNLQPDMPGASVDNALQLSAVWQAIEILSYAVGTLPLMVYSSADGKRTVARSSVLWQVLHTSPNRFMTAPDFMMTLCMNFFLRGNAYARIDRDGLGEVVSLWPMPSEQVTMEVQQDGSALYFYRVGNDLAVLAEDSVLHIRGVGNGLMGLGVLDFMRATVAEAAAAQSSMLRLFANANKPSGVLMVDRILSPEHRKQIRQNFAEMATGPMNRLYVLEADMKYQQLSLSPAEIQALEFRRLTTEDIARWLGVPVVLLNQANVTSWGSGIEQLIEGFVKFKIGPVLKIFEASFAKHVLTPSQRARFTVEFNADALLRMSPKARYEMHASAVQNGLRTRNEARGYENDPPIAGGDGLTVQSNLLPIELLGRVNPGSGNQGVKIHADAD
jgi:HK97 family phage portal protein